MIIPVVIALVVGLITIANLNLDSIFPARRVTVVTGEWGPTSVSSEPNGGPAGTLVKTVLAMAGYDAEIVFMPWETAYERVERGEAFGAYPVVASPERAEKFRISTEFFKVQYSVFYNRTRTNPESMTPERLRNSSTAFLSGYDYWPSASTDFPNRMPAKSESDPLHRWGAEVAFGKLLTGEVTFVLEGRAQGEFIVNAADFPGTAGDFQTLTPEMLTSAGLQEPRPVGLHLLLPKKISDYALKEINAKITSFMETTEYTRLAEAADGCQRESATIVGGDSAIHALEGEEISVPTGSEVAVLAWNSNTPRCASTAGIPYPRGTNDTLVKFTSGPATGALALVPPARLQIKEEP